MPRENQPQSLTLTMAKGQRADPAGDEKCRPRARTRHVMTPDFGKLAPADQHGDQSDGNVDQKDPAPVGRDQDAADQRPERCGKAADSGPGPHRAATMLRRKRRQQQAERGRRHQRGACRLHDAERNQAFDSAGDGAGGRCRREEADAEQKTEVAPMPLGKAAEEHQKCGIGDRVAVQDP
jgi:hypothetical protein